MGGSRRARPIARRAREVCAGRGASGASAARRTKHEAILGLQHMHDLDEVEAAHGGDGPVGDDEME